MDFDRAIADLPSDMQSYIRTSLTDNHIRVDDPLVAVIAVVAQMNRYRRPKVFVFLGLAIMIVVSAASWALGMANGRATALAEAYKPRPMVTFTVPGTSILYGAQAGRQVFMVDCSPKTVESTWVSKGVAFVSVK